MPEHDTDVPEYRDALAALRAIAAEWPGVTETLSWGNPTFKANGKSFAVLDRYQGGYCVWLRCPGERRRQLLEQEGWFAAPYDRRQSAICRRLDGLDWNDFGAVLRESYENVMPG